jgi:hypothetical protein
MVAKSFCNNIGCYNNDFAFASLGIMQDHFLGHGWYNFDVYSKLSHIIGSLFVKSNECQATNICLILYTRSI